MSADTNGRVPVRHSNDTEPVQVRAPVDRAGEHAGLLRRRVGERAGGLALAVLALCVARPKSTSLGRPSVSTMMLCGLTFR
jgi:hypothetical protein